jgi:hypothetical protein
MRWEHGSEPEAPSALPGTSLRRRRASRRSRLVRLTLCGALCSVLGGLTVVGTQSALNAARAAAGLHLVASSAPKGKVALGSATVERRLGYVTVTGDVVNRSARSLTRIEAVVELLDKQNRPLQLESGLITFDPLPRGESSPFRVELPDNVRAVAFRVRFRQLLGAALN